MENGDFEYANGRTVANWIAIGAPTYSTVGPRGSAAVRVTTRDFLVSEPVSIYPGECYELRMMSRSAEPDSVVRLQVNWVGHDGRELDPSTASIQLADAANDWQESYMSVRAPAGGNSARVYATAHRGTAWVDNYVFRRFADGCPAGVRPPATPAGP